MKVVNNTSNPCRAYPILARHSPKAVILRRGPSDWVQLILWHVEQDEFEFGQWFKGRIYERRCDISLDGSLFIYFAQKKSKRMMADKDYTYAWTAISKPPYLTALALWPKGDCWHGGGIFLENHKVWLNHHPRVAIPHPDHLPKGLVIEANPQAKGEDMPVFTKRLEKEGWAQIQRIENYHRVGFSHWEAEQPSIWTKNLEGNSLVLRMIISGSNFKQHGDKYIVKYDVLDPDNRVVTSLAGSTWADWDHFGRLVFIWKGMLMTVEPGSIYPPRVIQDLNPQIPKQVRAPEWASEW